MPAQLHHAIRVHSFGSLEDLVLERVPAQDPGPEDVVIDVRAAGLNFPDLLLAGGTYQTLPELPFTLGMEASGVVTAVGEDVTAVARGDRVIAQVPHGSFTRRLVAAQSRVFQIPDSMSFPEAGALGLAALTAYFGLVRRAKLEGGETVLVTGVAGGVGAAAAYIAKARGARVIGASRDPEAAVAVAGEAVDEYISSKAEGLRDAVLSATGGRGADIVFDVVGGDVLTQALRAVAWEGRCVVVGFASGGQQPIKPGHLLVKNTSVVGLQVSDYMSRRPDLVRAAVRELGDDYEAGRFRIPVTSLFAFEDFGEALRQFEEGRIKGKAVLVLDPSGQDARVTPL
jgi:NADPH2:quinone reductase